MTVRLKKTVCLFGGKILLIGCLSSMACAVWGAGFDELVSQSKGYLQSDRLVEALASARDAVRAKPGDYRGYYYVAMALMAQGKFDDAEAAAVRALSLAPAEIKPSVDKLVTTVVARKEGADVAKTADNALADGLIGKAADLYAQAWRAGRNRPELALKGADLYSDKLGQPIDAGILLREVVSSAEGSTSGARATEELKRLAPVLRDAAQHLVDQARQQQSAQALLTLQQAQEIDPDVTAIYTDRFRVVSRGDDPLALQNALKDLSRRGLASENIFLTSPDMARWVAQPIIAGLLADIFGRARFEQLKSGVLDIAEQNLVLKSMGVTIGQAIKDCADCPELVLLPKGSFVMGSPDSEKDRDGDEGPTRTVTIGKVIAVGRYEVTRAEFGRFVAESQYKTEAERGNGCLAWDGSAWKYDAAKNWRDPGFKQGEDHPVVCVSWNDTQEYLKWLNQKVPSKNFRLLSEAEWEYSARAGQGASRFPWGDDLDYTKMCTFANGVDETAKAQVPGASGWTISKCSDGYAYTAPVTALQPNAFGLMHMHGNVREWVQDVRYDNYTGAPTDGSAWEGGGDAARRVLRGGSWLNFHLRSALRNWGTPDYRRNFTGFRIARTFTL